jgi:hypothetical protein
MQANTAGIPSIGVDSLPHPDSPLLIGAVLAVLVRAAKRFG